MRLAKLVSFVVGALGLAVIAVILLVVIPDMGGSGFLRLLVTLILLTYALVHLVPAAGLLLPWVLDRVPPQQRWGLFLGWLASAVPVLAFDLVLLLGRSRPA